MRLTLLDRLDGVRRTGDGRWIARCPAHEDRSPSLSIRVLYDGRTLLHCFGGCAVDEVINALGLDMSDLFPPRNADGYRTIRRPVIGDDMLRCLSRDALYVAVAADALVSGELISDDDRSRLYEAAARFRDGIRVCLGGRKGR